MFFFGLFCVGVHQSNFFSPDTDSDTSAQDICQCQYLLIRYQCSLFPKLKICKPHWMELI